MQAVAGKHALSRRIRRAILCGTWLPQSVAICLVSWATVLSSGTALQAGCHYNTHSRGRMNASAIDNQNPRAHARNFAFLGQWIYEGGEIKYVPWQGAPPCQGPDCQADDDRPVTNGQPSGSNVRDLPTLLAASRTPCDAPVPPTVVDEPPTLGAVPGYPHEREYPP